MIARRVFWLTLIALPIALRGAPTEDELAETGVRSEMQSSLEAFACFVSPQMEDHGWIVISYEGLHEPSIERLPAGSGNLVFIRRDCKLDVLADGNLLVHHSAVDGEVSIRLYDSIPHALELQKLGRWEFSDDFARENIDGGGVWEKSSGDWHAHKDLKFKGSPNAFSARGTSQADAILLSGYHFLNHLDYSVAILNNNAREFGVVFGYQDTQNYFKAVIAQENHYQEFRIFHVYGNDPKMLYRTAVSLLPGSWYRFQVKLHAGDGIEVGIDDRALYNQELPHTCLGRFGLFVAGGSADFDDVEVISPPATKPVLARTTSHSVYSVKPRFINDRRDEHFDRWATDADAWRPGTFDFEGTRYAGYEFHLPFMGDFKVTRKDPDSERLLVLHRLDRSIRKVVRLGAGTRELALVGNELRIDGQPLETAHPPEPVTVGYYSAAPEIDAIDPTAPVESDDPDPEIKIDPENVLRALGVALGIDGLNLTSHQLVHEHLAESAFALPDIVAAGYRIDMFEDAPTDWLRLGGDWKIASRWQCAHEWGFYIGRGPELVAQTTKLRFKGDQAHTIYFGMQDVFARKYKEQMYIRRDVNVSFMTDGLDLFSGYTFMFGGYNNKASYLFRGREIVAVNEDWKFMEFVDINDLHLFWQQLRFERIGNRIRILLDRNVIFDYKDPEAESAPQGGHLTLWTWRNGIVYARLNSSAEAITDNVMPVASKRGEEHKLPWRSLNPGYTQTSEGVRGRTIVSKIFSGGEFSVVWEAEPIDLTHTPKLHLDLRIPQDVKVSLFATVGSKTIVIPLTAPLTDTYRLLGSNHPRGIRKFVAPPLRLPTVDRVPQPAISEELVVDLLDHVRRHFPDLERPVLKRLMIGNTSNADYLMAGRSGNAAGASYQIGEPRFTK